MKSVFDKKKIGMKINLSIPVNWTPLCCVMSIVVFTLSRQSSKMKQNELDYFLKKASTKTLLVKQN